MTGLSETAVRYTIDIPTLDSEAPGLEDTLDALMDAIELHAVKAKDYHGDENQFGLKGEIIGLTRKIGKLKRLYWDGKDPLFEGGQELLMDLIGNAALMLRMQKKTSDKYRAGWRDNHGNKPTFGFIWPAQYRRTARQQMAHPPYPDVDDFDHENED